VTWYPMVSYRPFVERGQVETRQDIDVSFCGNVWSAAVEAWSFSDDDLFSDLTAAVCRRKAEVPALSAAAWSRSLANSECRATWRSRASSLWHRTNVCIRIVKVSRIVSEKL
jgi:hypothetical protein